MSIFTKHIKVNTHPPVWRFCLPFLLLVPVLSFSQSFNVQTFQTEGNWLEESPLHNLEVYDAIQDSRGFLWFATLGGLMKFDGASFTVYDHDPSDKNSIGFIGPLRLLEDKQGKIWVTLQNGLSIFDPVLESFTNFQGLPLEDGTFDFNTIWTLEKDARGVVWLGTNKGLCNYDPDTGKFQHINGFNSFVATLMMEGDSILWISDYKPYLTRYNTFTGNSTQVYFHNEKGEQLNEMIEVFYYSPEVGFWVSTVLNRIYRQSENGLQDSGKIFMAHQIELDDLIITNIKASHNGDIWFMGREGLFSFDHSSGETFQVEFEGYNFKTRGKYYNFLEDSRSRYWASFEHGVVKWAPEDNRPFKIFDNFPINQHAVSAGTPAMKLAKFDEDRIMVGRLDGLFLFNIKNENITPASTQLPILSVIDTFSNVYLFRDENNGIWIKQEGTPLIRLNIQTNEVQEIQVEGWSVFSIVEGKNQIFWIGTEQGVFQYDLKNGIKKKFFPDSLRFDNQHESDVLSMVIENDSIMWMGTRSTGVNCLNLNTGIIQSYLHDQDDPESLSHNTVVDIHLDRQGYLWVATYGGGLCRLDRENRKFKRYLKDQGLNSLRCATIEEDDSGQIWVGTFDGVSSLDRQSGLFTNYAVDPNAPFRVGWWASMKDTDGALYFGGNFSFARIATESISKDIVFPEIVITELLLKNEQILPSTKNAPLKKNISFTDVLTLKHDQNFIGFRFAALNFIHPEKNQYAYRMKGLFEEWQYTGNKNEAIFTDLDPGEYLFQVKASNHDGTWNEEGVSITVKILHPWWATWWAYIVYFITIGSLILWVRRYELNRKLAKTESLRLRELDQTKTRLFTNITHEFRTPLTIILGMVDQIKTDPGNWFNEGIRLIKRNGNQLLHLVNQLLDLSKLESGQMPVKYVNDDVVGFLQYLVESFHSYADSKDVRLHFSSDFRELVMDYDSEKLQNIVSNLLSNAIKFTPAGGDVYFDLRSNGQKEALEPRLFFSIRDNGHGIASEHLPHIFDRFYQVDASTTRRGEGTGIGLALTKEMVLLLGGTIEVESELGKGAKFNISLPITQKAPKASAQDYKVDPDPISEALVLTHEVGEIAAISPESDLPLVLLVEDNKDVISYLASFLSGDYRIATALNGKLGIEKALELIPELIVSDVMMPEKDGFEVCEALKKDERTSHIPIILLTAKADQPSRMEGLTYGADAYLTKPFHKEELLVRVEKLIEQRRQLQERFQSPGSLRGLMKSSSVNVENIFLQKVINQVEINMGDENFGMPDLCKALNMSRSNLFRKLKALTGKSATQLIRNIRLEKGKELLETSDLTVSEVAYQVGFGSASYFSRMFLKSFGITPTEVRNN